MNYYYHTPQGLPLSNCPECGNDLTRYGGINLVLCVGGKVIEVSSRLDCAGQLEDTQDNAVTAGFHSGTTCGGCGELLINLDVKELVVEED